MATAGPTDPTAGLVPTEAVVGAADAVGAETGGVAHSRRRRALTFVAFGVAVLVLWELVKWLGGVPWRFQNVLGTRARDRARPAVPLGLRHRPEPAPLVQHPGRAGRPGPAQRGAVARPVPGRRRVLHLARGGDRLRRRRPARARPGHGLRPFAAARAGVRAVRRRQPDDPDRGPRADDRLRLRPERDLGRDHRHLPDLLPGHDRDDPRAARARSARPRADALVRRRPLGDLPQGAPARLAAVPVHRPEDRGHRLHRRRDHRRGTGRHPRRAWAARSSTSTSSTSAGRRSCGPRSSCRRCSGSRSSWSSGRPSSSSCAAGPARRKGDA